MRNLHARPPDPRRAEQLRTRGDSRCPGVIDLHPAEDGWLARVRLPGGRATSGQLEAIAHVASRGNGLVDITRRANVQIRGLAEGSGAEAASTLATAGLVPSTTHERVRNIAAGPLGGRHPAALEDTDAVVEELDRALCADDRMAGLPDRFLFGIDDGSNVLHDLALDVALVAEQRDAFRLWIAGSPTSALPSRDQAPAVLLNAASAFLDVRVGARDSAWHVRELRDGAASVAARCDATLVEPHGHRPTLTISPGICRQRDGRAAVTALVPLGRLDETTLTAVSRLTAELDRDVRFSPWRTVSIVDIPAGEAEDVALALARVGLVTEPGSGWEFITACVGVGGCTKARIDVRTAVAQRAAVRGNAAPPEHWSACERRCGEPRAVAISVAAHDGGLTVTTFGHANDVPDARCAVERLADRTAR